MGAVKKAMLEELWEEQKEEEDGISRGSGRGAPD
jgi:hypothetical protein